MSTISYAQAAKGQAASQASSQQISSAQSTSSQAKDDVPTANTPVTAPSVASSDVEGSDVGKSGQPDAEVTLPRQGPETTDDSVPPITPAADPSTKSSPESVATTADSSQQQDEKASRSVSRRSNDGPDSRRGRKGKKGRNNDKEAQGEQQQQEEKEKEKVVLSEAPLPTVNIWKQRQETRAKQAPSAISIPSNAPINGSESRKPHPTQEEGDAPLANGVTKDKSAKKSSDQPRNGEHGQRRAAPRGARVNEKDEKSSGNLPSVEDTSAWPDPKAAASSDVAGQKTQAKPAAVEREGREESRQSQTRSWQKMDVQHTVIFNTQFPTRGGHRPRGGARGGREAGSTREPQSNNGAPQNAATEKPTTVNGASATKGNTFHPRENNALTRAVSQNAAPAAPKRASVDGPAPKDQRKLSVSAQAESGQDSASDNAAPTTKKAVPHRAPPGDIRILNADSGSALPKTSAQERPKPSESGKEGQNTNNQQHAGRPERSRGGYRGRGGHNGTTGQHVHQNSYAQNGQYSASSFQSRQNPAGPSTSHSGQFPGYSQQSRGRGGQHRWNGSARNSSNGAGFPPRPAPQVGELPVQQYIPYQPYQVPHMYDGLIPMVKSQVEYYFSVGNLCKDLWLRSHMDCQGFVKLAVVASFNRMQKMTANGGLDLLRQACLHSDLIEFVIGEDQIERLRNREKWSDFVLQPAERIPELQHDTVINFTPYPSASQLYSYGVPLHQPYPITSPVAMYPPFAEDQGFQTGYTNGARFEQNGLVGPNGHHYNPETQLSALVPDFNPAPAPFTLDSLNNISDSRVENLIILDRVSSDASGAGAAGYISNNPHHPVMNGVTPRSGEQSNNLDVSNGVANSSRTTTWFKGQPAESPVERPYLHVKEAALAQRKQTSPGDTPEEMRHLYEFWSNMLLTAFNDKVYEEFRLLSFEDAAHQNMAGLRFLIEFFKNLYDTNVRKPWLQIPNVPEVFQNHYREAFDLEQKNAAPAVEKSA